MVKTMVVIAKFRECTVKNKKKKFEFMRNKVGIAWKRCTKLQLFVHTCKTSYPYLPMTIDTMRDFFRKMSKFDMAYAPM